MLSSWSGANPITMIVFGLVNHPAFVLDELGQEVETIPPLSNRHAILRPETADLRISNTGWINLSFDQRMSLDNTPDLFRYCRARILGSVSEFALPVRQFLDTYLDFVWAQTKILCPENDLYGAEDWAFSAWLPLPQVHVLLPSEYEDGSPQFAEVDIAFWQGGRLRAVLIEDSRTPIGSKRRRLDYLAKHHPNLELLSLPRDQVSDGQFPVEAFPEGFAQYWKGLPLPIGPAPPDL